MKKTLIALTLLISLTACTHPLDKTFTEENRVTLFEEIKASDKVTPEEKQVFAAYLLRSMIAVSMSYDFSDKQLDKDYISAYAQYLPTGKTAREMIKEQQEWQAKNLSSLDSPATPAPSEAGDHNDAETSQTHTPEK